MRRTAFGVMIVALMAESAWSAPAEQGCSYAVTPLTVTVSGAGGTGQITVSTSAACSWTATGTSWVSVSPASGVGSGTVTWVASPNPLRTQRFASMMIAGRAVFIGQSQPSTVVTPPGAPRQLAASVNGSGVTLTWSPPDSGGAPSSYTLAAGSNSGASNLANFSTANTLTAFTANGVPQGVYFVRVSAHNAAGGSAPSNEVTFTVGPPSCSAAPPSALQSTVNGSLVTISWTAPADGAATAYLVEVGSSPSRADLGSFHTGSPATTFSAHAPPGSYYVRVRAATPCGVTSPTADVAIVVQP